MLVVEEETVLFRLSFDFAWVLCAVLHKECINVTILQMCVSREQIYSRFFKGMGRVLRMLAQSFAVQFIFIALDVTGVLLSH